MVEVVDDVRQYGKRAAGHATGAGLGLDPYEQDEARRKEPGDHAGAGYPDDRAPSSPEEEVAAQNAFDRLNDPAPAP